MVFCLRVVGNLILAFVNDVLDVSDRGLDRLSDESSKGRADSDSHPEAWTDPDASDPPPSRASRLFHRDKPLGKPKKSASEPKQLTAPTLLLDTTAEVGYLLW